MRMVLLDRDDELTALGRQLQMVRVGTGRVMVVEGPAGIGKSSLLAAVAHAAEARAAVVLRARGGPLEQDAAWGLARQLFAPVRARADWRELAIGAARLAQRALDAEAPEPVPAGDAMHAAAHGLTWLVSNLAERGPTLLVVDDVHWADAPSLRWLAQLARRLDELAVGVLCAVRAGEPAGEPELLGELLAAAPEPPVRPHPLGPAAAEALVRERMPDADAAFAHACHAVTGGNPFLLRALLTQLVSERIAPTEQVASGLSAFGPEQVARSIERRLARLPDGAAPLARAYAVLGRGAPLRHAAGLAGLEPETAAHIADALRAAGLLEGDGGLAHPLVAGALYAGLGPGERSVRHAQAARLLACERADPEHVALHLLRTEPAGDPATVATLRRAASQAGARGAPQSAAGFLRRALAEPPPTAADDADVRLELGLALAAALERDAPALLVEAAELTESPRRRAEIALAGARALGLAGYFDDAIGLCRRGLEHAGDIPAKLLARLEAEFAGDAGLNAATARELDECLRRLASSPPPLELWRVIAAWGAVREARPARETRALLAPVFEAGALETDADSLLGTVAKLVLIANGDLDAAREHCGALIDFARPRGWRIALAHGSFLRAIALVHAGQIRDAEADARLAFDFKLAHGQPRAALIWSLFPLVDALTELGELDDADTALAAARLLGDPPVGALSAPMLLESRARLRLAQHRHTDAHADLVAAADRWSELGIRHPCLAAWRIAACEALAARGDLAAARGLAEEHLELAEQVALPGPRGAGLRALARTAQHDAAIVLLEQAVDTLAGSPSQLEHVRALVELGAALRRANRREAARRPLRQALDLADRGGMRLLARRARHELRAAGAKPRRAALAGVDALTPAEHRVATLAAHGYNNREIAEQLYITRRTVETHLTHAFQKLDIHGRCELPVLLSSPEPAPPPTPALLHR
jgi:DNA-binding NarL/FixJ family response regulator